MRTNVKISAIIGVLNGELPANTIVGNRKDAFGTFYVAFVATDKDTQEPLWDTEKDKVSLNWRKSLRQGG